MVNNKMMNNQYRTYGNEGLPKNTNLTRLPAATLRSSDIPPIDEITGESVMPFDAPLVPLFPSPRQEPATMRNPEFSQGYLQKHIGQNMRVEFLIGSGGALVDRTGTLIEVGEDYIVLQPIGSDDLLMCDLFSIKFVTISQ